MPTLVVAAPAPRPTLFNPRTMKLNAAMAPRPIAAPGMASKATPTISANKGILIRNVARSARPSIMGPNVFKNAMRNLVQLASNLSLSSAACLILAASSLVLVSPSLRFLMNSASMVMLRNALPSSSPCSAVFCAEAGIRARASTVFLNRSPSLSVARSFKVTSRAWNATCALAPPCAASSICV